MSEVIPFLLNNHNTLAIKKMIFRLHPKHLAQNHQSVINCLQFGKFHTSRGIQKVGQKVRMKEKKETNKTKFFQKGALKAVGLNLIPVYSPVQEVRQKQGKKIIRKKINLLLPLTRSTSLFETNGFSFGFNSEQLR